MLKPFKCLIPKDYEWCRETELNRRHEDFQSSALPTELSRHILIKPVEGFART